MEPSGVTHPRFPGAVAAALIALVAGCQSPAATAAPSATGSTPAATAGASAPATAQPTGAAPGLFHVVGSAPVIARTIVADRNAVLPGAVTVDPDGTYHAWIVAFTSAPGTQDVHHLTSIDGVAWVEVPDASLAALSSGLGNPGAIPTSVLPAGDGWVMYMVGTLATEREGWDIWRATAPGPDGPWTRDAQPVLRRGAAGAWDSGGLDFPSVLATANGYTMLFSAYDAAHRDRGSIGLATSADGIAWTKHDDPATTDAALAASDPVAGPGLCGGFDERAVHQPRVVDQGDHWVMAYAGYAGALDSRPSVGFADSLDGGLTWGCEWAGPALSTGGLPPGSVHTLAAFQRGERVALLVEWLDGNATDLWLADLGARAP